MRGDHLFVANINGQSIIRRSTVVIYITPATVSRVNQDGKFRKGDFKLNFEVRRQKKNVNILTKKRGNGNFSLSKQYYSLRLLFGILLFFFHQFFR